MDSCLVAEYEDLDNSIRLFFYSSLLFGFLLLIKYLIDSMSHTAEFIEDRFARVQKL